jgi:hypothetical protein
MPPTPHKDGVPYLSPLKYSQGIDLSIDTSVMSLGFSILFGFLSPSNTEHIWIAH